MSYHKLLYLLAFLCLIHIDVKDCTAGTLFRYTTKSNSAIPQTHSTRPSSNAQKSTNPKFVSSFNVLHRLNDSYHGRTYMLHLQRRALESDLTNRIGVSIGGGYGSDARAYVNGQFGTTSSARARHTQARQIRETSIPLRKDPTLTDTAPRVEITREPVATRRTGLISEKVDYTAPARKPEMRRDIEKLRLDNTHITPEERQDSVWQSFRESLRDNYAVQ